jgi:hypothetical protein
VKSCDEVQDLLPELLPWVRGAAFEVHEHLQRCAECAELADELAHTLRLLDASPGAPALDEAFALRVVQALPDDPGWSVGRAAGGRVIPLRALVLQGAAAAACFLAGAALTFGLSRGASPEPSPQPQARRTPGHLAPALPGWAPGAAQAGPVEVAAPAAPAWGAQPWPAARFAGDGPPLVRYVSQAGLVLEAVAELDQRQDPRALQLLRVSLQGSDLLDEGDQLLELLPPEPSEPGEVELRRLIAGTQLVLRKVRNARQDSAPELEWALRREVRETGLLDAYRELLARAAARGADAAAPAPAAERPPEDPPRWKPNDPL